MTVQDLIDMLSLVKNKERIVIMSKDDEGNGYCYCSNIDENVAYRDNDHDIECKLEHLTPSLKRRGYSSEDTMTDGKPALLIYPS